MILLAAAGIALALFLPRALAPLFAAERLFSFFVALQIAGSSLDEERKRERLLLLFLPWIGVLIHFGCKRPKTLPQSPVSAPFCGDGVMNCISSLSAKGCGIAGCGAEKITYFPTGAEMIESLKADLRGAEKEILLDFYILARGKCFDPLLEILEEKAPRVHVRLVYDDFGCATRLPRNFYRTLQARGIDAELFHPVKLFPPGRLNRRDHRKLAVIDGKIAYTGGVNLSDEYIGAATPYGNWKDAGVRVTGDAAERFGALFRGEKRAPALPIGSPCAVFGDDAENGPRVGEEILFRLFSEAKERLFVCTPYLSPSARLNGALLSAARAGVDVRIMIPHIPDKRSVFALTRDRARELMKRGVSVREYTAGFLHAKSALADGYSFLGSYNLDARSLRLQAECGIVSSDAELARDLKRDFCSLWESGTPVPRATFREKTFGFFLRLFSPLL